MFAWPWKRRDGQAANRDTRGDEREVACAGHGTDGEEASNVGGCAAGNGNREATSPAEGQKSKAIDDPYEPPEPPEELPRCLGGPIADMSEVARGYDTPEQVRLFLTFDGTVQGVGFRWTTQALARKVGVSGWVRNMDDGTVQAEMQGTGHDICRVLCALRGQFIDAWANYEVLRRMNFHFVITRCERRSLREDEADFSVRF